MEKKLRYERAWLAEVCEASSYENPANRQHSDWKQIESLDMDLDGRLEIWFRGRLLDQHGVRIYPEAIGIGCFYDLLNLGYPQAVSRTSDGLSIYDAVKRDLITLKLNTKITGRPLTIVDLETDDAPELIVSQQVRTPYQFGCTLLELPTGRQRWEYPTGPICYVDAFADLNNDGCLEMICSTYSPQHDRTANEMKAYGEGYIFVLDRSGNRLWLVTFCHGFIGTHAAVADLDDDGRLEVIGAAGSWLRDWGELVIIDAATGQVLYRKAAESSFTGLAVADLDGDGPKEIVTATAGETSQFLVFDIRLNLLSTHKVTTMTTEYDWINSYVEAICDLNGDGKLEVVGSMCAERVLVQHPRHHRSKFLEKNIFILRYDLSLMQKLPLEQKCTGAIVSDIIPGGYPEILVSADGLALYSVE